MNEEFIKVVKSQLIDFCDNVLNYKNKIDYNLLNNHEIFKHGFKINDYDIHFYTMKHIKETKYCSGYRQCYIDNKLFITKYSRYKSYNISFQTFKKLFDKAEFFNKIVNSEIDCNIDYEYYSIFKDLLLMHKELKNESICKYIEIVVTKNGGKDE